MVPDVKPGSYALQLCNDPCTKQLGDIMGGWDLDVVATAAEGRMLASVERVSNRVTRSLDRADRRTRRALRDAVARMEGDMRVGERRLTARIDRLEAEVSRLSESDEGVPTMALIAGAAASALGIGIVFAIRRRRRASTTSDPRVPTEWVQDDYAPSSQR